MLALRLLSNIESSLNQKGLINKKDEVSFWCPICKLEKHKKKLNINLDTTSSKFCSWHCWNCEISFGTAGKNIFSLYKKLNIKYNTEELSKISKGNNYDINNNIINKTNRVYLPNEFIPLYKNNNSIEYKSAIIYLNSRGIQINDIIRYNIGYCEEGIYAHRIIIPSYDENCELNYFITRTYYNNIGKTYKNPVHDKNSVIFFESLINWDFPIILVEGAFDAIAAGSNAIPLLGKYINDKIKQKIIINRVNNIYISLDKDALNTTIKYIEYFMNSGINVYYIPITDKDPSKIGRKQFLIEMENAIKMDFKNLIKLKLSLGAV